jgi:hypothetical protein
MSGPRVGTNLKDYRFGANTDRPNGCSASARSSVPEHLVNALRYGNRATRREVLRNLIKRIYKLDPPRRTKALAELKIILSALGISTKMLGGEL